MNDVGTAWHPHANEWIWILTSHSTQKLTQNGSPSQHQSLFQWVNSSHEVTKVLEFQLQHHSFQRTPRADLLRMDWLDLNLLAVQGTLKTLLQHHSSKASILRCSAFFTVQVSHPSFQLQLLLSHLWLWSFWLPFILYLFVWLLRVLVATCEILVVVHGLWSRGFSSCGVPA